MAKKEIHQMLAAHFEQNEVKPDTYQKKGSLELIATEARRRPRRGGPESFPRFVIAQLRFIRKRAWIAQFGLIAFALLVCALSEHALVSTTAISALAAASVPVGLPDVFRSQTDGVSEVEYACHFNSRQVTLARLIIFGLSDILMLTSLVIIAPFLIEIGPLSVFLHACTPYFITCAGCLLIINRTNGEPVMPLCFAFGTFIALVGFFAFKLFPHFYLVSSLWVWGMLCLGALIIVFVQVKTYLRRIAAGIDHLQPATIQ